MSDQGSTTSLAQAARGAAGDPAVNRFRRKRGEQLTRMIDGLSQRLGRPVDILDVGGKAGYWRSVGLGGVGHVTVLNYDAHEFGPDPQAGLEPGRFSFVTGDARNLADYADGSVDLVHSNSVIEHVGAWPDMKAMAEELMRIGVAGWVQTPAWEFPLEPHFRVPFMHWFAAPARRRLLWFSRPYRAADTDTKRAHVDRINLLSRPEVETLFKGRTILVERALLLPKSYVIRWGD